MENIQGTILGITPKFENLTTRIEDKWGENIYGTPVIEENHIRFSFSCSGINYSVNLQSKDKINFQGKVMGTDEVWGHCNFVLYSNEKSILLIGDWIEEGEEYSCIVQLNKIQIKL